MEGFIPNAMSNFTLKEEGKETLIQMWKALKELEELKRQQWEKLNDVKIKYKTIYIQSDPNVCYERIKMRNQPGDKLVTLGDLENLHSLHEQWIRNRNEETMILDKEKSFEEKIKIITNL